jgi:hypothetical protein
MQRDMNLVRQILLAIEDHEHGRAPSSLSIDGYNADQIGYHVYIMIEGGLVAGADITAMGSRGFEAIPTRLTWAGHEFLDAARDDSRWQKAITLVRDKAGSVTIGVMTQLLASMSKQSLGLGDAS